MEDIVKNAVRVLNEFLEKDPEACNQLYSYKTPANKVLLDHPTIQVDVISDTKFKVGFLGVLNGIIEPCCGKRVAVILDNNKVVGFTEYKIPKTAIPETL
jgi:hypothetical protein